MSTSLNSGHAKNAANLAQLNQILITFGGSYNPANKHISLASLQALQIDAQEKLDLVNQALTTWKNDTNNREIAFQDLDRFSTRLLAALQSTTVSQQTINDFQALVSKIRGDGRPAHAEPAGSNNPANPPLPPAATVSTSRQSFDNKIELFGKMLLLLQAEPLYTPNEAGFSVPELSNKLALLNAANNAVNASQANLKAMRISRNLFFYKDVTGLLSTIKQVKLYVKSLYGANSQQYKAVVAIPFVRVVPVKKAN